MLKARDGLRMFSEPADSTSMQTWIGRINQKHLQALSLYTFPNEHCLCHPTQLVDFDFGFYLRCLALFHSIFLV